MTPPEWIFDPIPPSGSMKGGLANAQVFDPEVDSFVREVLQNSRDQKLDTCDHVAVRFVLRELSGNDLSEFLSALAWDQLEPHVETAADQGGITISERLRDGLDELATGTLRVMAIEDRGTRGLTGGEEEEDSNFNALTRHELITSADRRDSGGSFGIGKSVLWRFSNLSTVLFGSWLSDEDRMRFFGRTLLPTHETPDGGIWEGSGWYGLPESRPGGQRAVSLLGHEAQAFTSKTYVDRESGETGTSILVLGFDEPTVAEERELEEVCGSLVQSAARWFWPGLVRGDMRVSVEGWRNDDQEFVRHVNPTEPEILPFVEAVNASTETDDSLDAPGEVVERELSVWVPAQRPRPGADEGWPAGEVPARLRIRYAESSETDHLNTVALERGTGMVVQYRPIRVRADVGFGFHGTLEIGSAHGETDQDRAAEEFLRAAEPPAHAEWTHKTERVKAEYETGAKAALDSLFGAIEQAVRDFTREETVATDEGPDALRKLFPLPGIGPSDPKPTYQLTKANARLDGDCWDFNGVFTRREASEDEWPMRVRLVLDQETGGSTGGGETVRIDSLDAEGCQVDGPQADGSFLVVAPAKRTETSFAGQSAPIEDLPAGGLHRVRIRLEVRTVQAAEVPG